MVLMGFHGFLMGFEACCWFLMVFTEILYIFNGFLVYYSTFLMVFDEFWWFLNGFWWILVCFGGRMRFQRPEKAHPAPIRGAQRSQEQPAPPAHPNSFPNGPKAPPRR